MGPYPLIAVDDARVDEIDDVRALVVAGLAERFGAYDSERNPDLRDLRATYVGETVLVARELADGERIVGCGTLIEEAPGVGRLVRMSVAADRRRRGVASAVLLALLERARERGFRSVVVETTATWASAVAFYERHDFARTHRDGEEQHFRREL